VIVYALTYNQRHEGGSLLGVYSTEQKAREEAEANPAQVELVEGYFFWEIIPVEVDGTAAYLDSIHID
jgi:hypothetical protein